MDSLFRTKTDDAGAESHPLTQDKIIPPCDRWRNSNPTPHPCRRIAVANSSHSNKRRTAPLRLLLMARRHTTTPTVAAIVVPPLRTPTLVAENPASLRISGDQGSSTACHPVRRSRKTFTLQQPFTPFPVPCPVPKPLPIFMMRINLSQLDFFAFY